MNSRPVQMLKYKKQTGMNSEICLYATHTRLAHCVGVMGLAAQMLDNMYERDFFEGEDKKQLKRDISVAALLHDVGHPPFSHAAEGALEAAGAGNHNERTEELIRGELAGAIHDCGSDSERIVSLLDKKDGNPRGKIITSKSLGADKIGYLYQDQRITGHNAALPPDYRQLLHYLCFAGNELKCSELETSALVSFQNAYFSMYTDVYLRRQALSFERILLKALQLAIKSGDIDASKVWDEDEGWVQAKFKASKVGAVRELNDRIVMRNGLKAAVAFRYEGYEESENVGDKHLAVVSCGESYLSSLAGHYADLLKVAELENLIASEFKLKDSEIVVTRLNAPSKLIPEDVPLVSKAGFPTRSLFKRLPGHKASLEEKAKNFFALRVMVDEKHRARVAGAHKVIADIVKADYSQQKLFDSPAS